MMIREPAFAGRFYADGADACRVSIDQCLRRAESPAMSGGRSIDADRLIGCVLPHAGWVYSGGVAARVLREFAERTHPQVFVIFGAIHVPDVGVPSIFDRGAWETPLGLVGIDDRLSERLMGQTGLLRADPHAHDHEHSIEVEIPFIQQLMPETLIVPIMVPPDGNAAALGRAVGRTCRSYGVRAAIACSTDLTHYGPSFGFTSHGVGADGVRWARDVNDRRMIDLMLAMEGERAVEEAITNRNACGGGAIAATLEACKAMGAQRATLLEHTTSDEIGRALLGQRGDRDSVGYAGLVFG
ncbi:MAG: AmmeMemoRadiSam system protein B [Phycisphaerales bacterium]|nr:AmmeMemoRadiSam system protein B [Phycisphaerales bacterium]MCB9857246.1 AmmeMemoRadiSam system protein B [Phycisphaerales bacterium]MCB9863040.1 AmmeMemoRadiSam system protein B [Phycisphaerales bacterium]